MGLASDLGYQHRTPNPLQRAAQAFGASPVGAKLFKLTLAPLDDLVAKVSKGRQSAPEILAGLPVLDIVTTGRRSGAERRTHLIAIPYEDTLALVGSNFGQAATPAWVLNLEADPRLTVTYRGVTLEAIARPATEEEAATVLARSESVYPGYRLYQSRIGTSRRLRIFVLEPR
jgi:deazaflavin-dependent oxidoreductase (nitroreductase family)